MIHLDFIINTMKGINLLIWILYVGYEIFLYRKQKGFLDEIKEEELNDPEGILSEVEFDSKIKQFDSLFVRPIKIRIAFIITTMVIGIVLILID